jgi:Sulfotransferase domain
VRLSWNDKRMTRGVRKTLSLARSVLTRGEKPRSPIFTEIGGQYRSPSYGLSLTSRPDGKLVVFGLPKSGNAWLVSLLVDYFDLPAIAPQVARNDPGIGMCHLPYSESIAERPDFLHGVYLLRDLRDIVVSYFYHAQRADFRDPTAGIPNCEFDTIEEFYFDWFLPRVVPFHRIPTHADEYAQRSLPVVRYEKLCENPALELRRLLHRLGLPSEDARIFDVVEKNRIDKLQKTGRQLDVYVPPAHFRRGGHGGFKEELSDRVLRHISLAFGDMLLRWGYES